MCTDDEREERRLRILHATEARLAQLDLDNDAGCATGKKDPFSSGDQ